MTNNAKLKRDQDSLFYAYDSSIINDEEFVLLYEISTLQKALTLPTGINEAFELDNMSDECQARRISLL